MTRILVTGSRDWDDEATIRSALMWAAGDRENVTLVHGDCPTGADAIADKIARELGLNVEKHPADWDQFGKYAGPKRNKEMVDLGADVVLAFPQGLSKGTRGCMKLANEAGLTVINYGG